MLLIPYGTDAPIYHRPVATIGLIVANVLLIALPGDIARPWMLTLGGSLHPEQWLTHAFLHQGLGQLIGDMVFLWIFGLIVEGKAGAWWTLAAYVLVAMIHGAALQMMWPGLTEPLKTSGAAAPIFGLAGMAMIWAPLNSISSLWIGRGLFMWYMETFEIPIALYVAGNVTWDIVSMLLRHIFGPRFFAEGLGDASGVVLGAILGSILLKSRWVDCENWDAFAVLTRRAGRVEAEKKKTRRRGPRSAALRERFAARSSAKTSSRADRDEVGESPRREKLSGAEKVAEKVNLGEIDAALRLYDKTSKAVPFWPSERELMDLIKRFHARGAVIDSIPLMRDYCRRYPDTADRIRLKLAQILIRDHERPTLALRILAELPERLPPSLEPLRRDLTQKAEAMLEDGVLELEGEE